MLQTEQILNSESKLNPIRFSTLTATALESVSLAYIKIACEGTPFNPNDVKLVSGHKFPDIITGGGYGVEVKSTKYDHWTSTGSSIVESTRIDATDKIYMLFGKLGGTPPEFKCRPYEDVLYDIAVTHSPRYLIDMEITKNETIFAKMGTTYDQLRTSTNTIEQVRQYYREKAISENKEEMPWWLTSENYDSPKPFNLKLWNALDCEMQRFLNALSLILFPEIYSTNSQKKYHKVTLWLCSCYQVIHPNIRDNFSAGGKIRWINGRALSKPIPQVFKTIVELAPIIKKILDLPSSDIVQLIQEFNPDIAAGGSLYTNWLDQCCKLANEMSIPDLRTWIQTSAVLGE